MDLHDLKRRDGDFGIISFGECFMKSANKMNHEVQAATARAVSAISYEELVDKIGAEWERGRNNAIRAVNIEYVQTKWRIGRYIVEFEQHGKTRAKYGTGLIDRLAHDLTARHGRGFSRSKLIYARLFYIAFPKGATVSHFLERQYRTTVRRSTCFG